MLKAKESKILESVMLHHAHDQLCLTGCSLSGSSVYVISQQEYWSGLLFPSPGIKPGSPAMQADSLPTEQPLLKSCHFEALLLTDCILTELGENSHG